MWMDMGAISLRPFLLQIHMDSKAQRKTSAKRHVYMCVHMFTIHDS